MLPNICQTFQGTFLCQLGEQLAKTGITVSAIRSTHCILVRVSSSEFSSTMSRPGDGFSSSPTGDFVTKFKTTGSDRYFLMRRGLNGKNKTHLSLRR